MSSPTLTIREATADDLPAITRLWMELNRMHAAHDPSWTVAPEGEGVFRKGLEAGLRLPQTVLRVAVDDTDEVIGYCHGIVQLQPAVWAEDRVGSIVSICVAPAARSEGTGAALIDAVIDRFRAEGIARVETRVSVDNADGLRFWGRMRFLPHSHILSHRIDAGE